MRASLATRLFTAQVLVIGATFGALLVTILLVAPGLFRHHLQMTGEDSPSVQNHAQEAFETSVGLALLAAAAVAILAAVLLAWFLARRVSGPIEELAGAAEQVAHGEFDVSVPQTTFGRELHSLAQSFQEMAEDLASTDEARARLLSDLAHELRTPLATLEAHIDGMEDGVVVADAHNYEVMRSQVHRLQRLASDVKLAAAAQEHALDLQLQPVEVAALVNAACAAHAARYAEKGVELSNACTDDLVVQVDPDRMQQVLGNLLVNALRHTPTGGRVALTCRAGDDVRIAVTDNGEGIPADQLEAVFDRFHRVDASRSGGGSGLGLTIARAIAEDHGGSLRALANPAGGTVMLLTLPLRPY